MSERQAVSKATALRYRSASKCGKAVILDELCALTGWHRDHARKALRPAVRTRSARRAHLRRPAAYGEVEMAALRKVWAVLDAPAGRRLAPFLPEINLLRGVFGTFRNPTAHAAPRTAWIVPEDDALDLFSTLSYLHRRLDGASVTR